MSKAQKKKDGASVDITTEGDALQVVLAGRLDVDSVAPIWQQCLQQLAKTHPAKLTVDAGGLTFCDVSGMGLILDLQAHMQQDQQTFDLVHFPDQFNHLLKLLSPDMLAIQSIKPHERCCTAEDIGRATVLVWKDAKELISFIGELWQATMFALLNPHKARWPSILHIMEKAGVNAFPIIAMLGFILGLILAFQSAIPLHQFAADIFVTDMVALALFRELGPLITAIILAGRSGSAFAAELGTMKVNDEINALVTMGLDPIRFLAVPRVIAASIITPLLAIFANLFGLVGAALVVLSLGFPLVTFVNRAVGAVSMADFLGGMFKSFVFGILIAGVGCLRGLQTKAGAQAVGDSTTNSVVSSIVLIVITDGLFSVLFYYLGI
jgi:phospholipid/cholesterol/gamma-HCH transport system permease protein